MSVTAVVRDRKGRFVRDLERADFVVAESGRQKPILDFRTESDGPVRLALLFDVLPTLMYLHGLPVSRELGGRVVYRAAD